MVLLPELMERFVCEDNQDLSSALGLQMREETHYYPPCAIPGNSTDVGAVTWDRCQEQRACHCFSIPSFLVVCQSQLAGVKQTVWLYALHQLIRLTGWCDLSKGIYQLKSTVSHHTYLCLSGLAERKIFSRNQK